MPQSDSVETRDPLEATQQKVDRIADLLQKPPTAADPAEPAEQAEAADPEQGEAETTDQPAEQASAKLTLKALAEKLGVEASDLYAVEIPLGDGTTTLGAWKDRVQEIQRVEQTRKEFQQQRREQENDLMRSYSELSAVLQSMGQIPPEVAKAAQKLLDSNRQRQAQLLAKVLPTWSDSTVREAAHTGMTEYLGRWGFSEAEATQLAGMDHRLVKFIHDHWRDASELAAIKETPKLPKAAGVAKQTRPLAGAAKVASLKKSVASGQMRPEDAIAKLLGG